MVLGQFCFYQQLAQPHINFRAVKFPVRQRDTRSKSELWDGAGFHVKHRTDAAIPKHTWIAEHIH